MSYYEERCLKAKAIVNYAVAGFRRSVLDAAEDLPDVVTEDIDKVPAIFEQLLLEYEALQEVRGDYARAKERLEEEQAKEAGQ